MPQEAGFHCAVCQRQTLHRDAVQVNHVLHAVISIFTCGLWVIPWFIIMAQQANDSAWRCTVCGNLVYPA